MFQPVEVKHYEELPMAWTLIPAGAFSEPFQPPTTGIEKYNTALRTSAISCALNWPWANRAFNLASILERP